MNRLRDFLYKKRGTLAAGGASIASEITLPGTFEMYSWNLDSVGNWKKTTQTPVAGSETRQGQPAQGGELSLGWQLYTCCPIL